MLDRNNYAIIMAGGIGSRFWPISTKSTPKQFLDIMGVGKTLIRQTFERFAKIIPVENIYIVTNEVYGSLVFGEIPELGENQVLLEPSAKNTAPCIAYASYKIKKENPLAVCIVAPSDHLVLNENAFLEVVERGMAFCKLNSQLLCIGIKPHRPDTGYGYIQFDENNEVEIFNVKTFTEKPNQELAQQFIESGDFLWNAGIFIWNIETITNSFEKHIPEMHNLFSGISNRLNTMAETSAITEIYPICTNISIDYGLLEKADNVKVIPGDFGWSDIGTWASLYDVYAKDENNNAINGEMVRTYNTSGCMISVPKDKLVVLNGIENIIVVESDKVLLISDIAKEQEVKQIVTNIKLEYGERFT